MTKHNTIHREEIPELFMGYQYRNYLIKHTNEDDFEQWLYEINWRMQEIITTNCREAYKHLLRQSEEDVERAFSVIKALAKKGDNHP